MVVRPADRPLGPLLMVRWLLWPALFVAGSWCMLVCPGVAQQVLPALWSTGGKGLDEVLPPRPKTRVQTFDLAVHAKYFMDHCGPDSAGRASQKQCDETLQLAAEVVGRTEPVTPKQLLGMRDFWAELDAEKSSVDRVVGLFSFINIVWFVSVLGIVGTIGPCIAYLLGPLLLGCARALVKKVLAPAAKFMHENGIFEAMAYLASFAVAVQGLRYPEAQADAGMMVGLTGGLFMIPCWAYSTALHVKGQDGNQAKFFMLSNALIAAALAPSAIAHDSRLIGFVAVLAAYGAMGFLFQAFGFGFLVGFDSRDALYRCLASSVLLVVLFTSLRTFGLSPRFMRPFATGAMCLGNVMYFLAMLIISSDFRRDNNYKVRNATMLASLVLAVLVGSVFALPAMTNTACVFFVLWAMTKEVEQKWGEFVIVVMFLNFVAMYYIAHYLNTHPELVTSMFNPEGLYLA